MFKNNRLLYLLLAVTIIVAALIILFPRFLLHNSLIGDTTVYTDKEFGYSVSVPRVWSISSSSNPVQFFTPASNSTGSSTLHMEIFATPQELPLADYVSSLNASTSGIFEQLRLNDKSVYKESFPNIGPSFSSYYFQNPESPTLYILTFSPDLSQQSSVVEKALSSFKFSVPISTSIFPLPTSATPEAKFNCPDTGWIDCMPSIGSQKVECTQDFVNWASKNCPDFKGIAY